ncbi:MAG: 6-carboxytetrahydropterin synthase [Chloroflexota bacterium]
MYTLTVQRDFVAQHYLVGGDWGAENERHSHHYTVEVTLEGESLDEHGFLVDIVDLTAHLDSLVAAFRDRTLNDLPAFAGLNPSIEHFSRIFCTELAGRIKANTLDALVVTIWEDEIARASYRAAL